VSTSFRILAVSREMGLGWTTLLNKSG
jgi:hypothetical protein